MASGTATQRAPIAAKTRTGSLLGRPLAFLVTATVLFAAFSWTFIADPDRVAPTKDPAYYTWRTEALLTEPPGRLLEVEGALGMFEGGYRVAAPILGGLLRRVADVPTLRMTVYLMVLLPVAIALLLAGYAYRQRRDPLLWHSVALGSGSLLLTPPFVGYLDNVLCLFFLAASLFFLDGARRNWPHRIAFASLLVLAGLTHPTTLAFFGLVLGGFAAVRLLVNGCDLREAWREESPLLMSAGAAAVVVGLIWTVGVWGQSAALTESALPPPYASSFFIDRMMQWIGSMGPILNGPLIAIGLVGLLEAGRKAFEEDLSKITLVWLAPLAGLFGFIAGLTYPYYRFFNTTLSWVLLVGLGIYFVLAFLRQRSEASARPWLLIVGVVAAAAVIGSNFVQGYDSSNWNESGKGWISDSTRADMDALRTRLATGDEDRPVIFVIDDEPSRDFQIWGFTKLSGNTSRYGLPAGSIDQGYLYLGDLENLMDEEPTLRGEETYDKVSRAVLDESLEAVAEAGEAPVVVLADAFNPKGANAGLAADLVSNAARLDLEPQGALAGADLLAVSDGAVVPFGSEEQIGAASRIGADPNDKSSESGALHVLLVLIGLTVLLLPGYFLLRWLLPDAGLAQGLGLVPALSAGVLALAGVVALAIIRQPLSGPYAWALSLATIAGTWLLARRGGVAGRV